MKTKSINELMKKYDVYEELQTYVAAAMVYTASTLKMTKTDNIDICDDEGKKTITMTYNGVYYKIIFTITPDNLMIKKETVSESSRIKWVISTRGDDLLEYGWVILYDTFPVDVKDAEDWIKIMDPEDRKFAIEHNSILTYLLESLSDDMFDTNVDEDTGYRFPKEYNSIMDQICEICDFQFVDSNAQPQYCEIRDFNNKYRGKYKVGPGEVDSFGWVTGLIVIDGTKAICWG